MLLGLLYCPSNKEQRANKLYELVEIELTQILTVTDPELVQFVPILYEISLNLMFKVYEKHVNDG